MTDDQVQDWLDAYVKAWRINDPDQIAALFSEDATYGYVPWEEPMRGRATIVDAWLRSPDEPGSWEAAYRPVLVAGNRAVASGQTRYLGGKTFENLWLLTFDDEGRCSAFEEWYMAHPEDAA